jgi:hypothetical protein
MCAQQYLKKAATKTSSARGRGVQRILKAAALTAEIIV